MSESIKLKKLSDIRNDQWYIENGGRIKRKDGTYKGVDYYPEYFYDARDNNSVYLRWQPLLYISFKMISPRTITYRDKIGMILIKYKFANYQIISKHWCNEWELDDWLERWITSGLDHTSSSSTEIPRHRRSIQKLNEQQREEELEREYEEYLNDYSDSEDDYYNDEYDRIYHYEDYTWGDMIDDAFEGDESNYWNID